MNHNNYIYCAFGYTICICNDDGLLVEKCFTLNKIEFLGFNVIY